MKIVFRRLATVEVREIVAWYNLEKLGLGREFCAALHNLLRRIASHPLSCPLYHMQFRRAVMNRFPYILYYIPDPNEIRVFRVVHTSRDPASIRDSLS